MTSTGRACIFCDSRHPARTVTHIVPESLGGPQAPVAPAGVTCDSCNQYFGQKVEAPALRSYPFVGLRLLASVPSKKGRFVELPTILGSVRGVGYPGLVELEPSNEMIAKAVASGKIRQVHLLAEVSESLAVCRLLLKIGLELLAKHFPDVAVSPRVAAAREFARRPQRGARWWCVLRADPSGLILSSPKPAEPWSVEIAELGHRLHSILRLSGVTSLVPLETDVLPPKADSLPESIYRVVWATC